MAPESSPCLSTASPCPDPSTPPSTAPSGADEVAMLRAALAEQGRQLAAIQATLGRLVAALQPGGEVVVGAAGRLDPMGAGYHLSQRDLAERLGLSPSTISALVHAFHLDDDARLAVTIRSRGSRRLVNYHPDTVERFRELLASPPDSLDHRAQRTVEQARLRLGLAGPPTARDATPQAA
jgi:hypothetical protein